jgi:2-oxoglutarate dehydrogenase E1 component
VKRDDLKKISKIINTIPNEFNLNPLVKKVYEERDYCVQGETFIDWGNAEMLAYGTLLHEGFGIRLTGEDVERGTFSHRHAVAIDQSHNTGFLALGNLLNENNKNLLTVNNSPLSEYSTLGFEYGFSVNAPQFLTLWEAQFGDFANGGQVIIDQFIANGEKKWGRMSGLVLLLPHGYDGQGPEHSNCRIERYLASVSDDYLLAKENPSYRKGINYKTNMTVCYVTSAANIFLLLRKQLLRNFRKPLIVLQSKKLLRSKLAASDFNDFLEPNIFKKLIDDPIQNKQKVTKIIFCSGQVYFDVIQKRSDLKLDDSVAVIRLEQVAPFPYVEASDIIKNYNKDAEVLWVQEEAYNYGPFTYVRPRIDIILEENGFKPIEYRGRKIQATTSTGFLKEHKKELEDFLTETFK